MRSKKQAKERQKVKQKIKKNFEDIRTKIQNIESENCSSLLSTTACKSTYQEILKILPKGKEKTVSRENPLFQLVQNPPSLSVLHLIFKTDNINN